jgi:hypothetical protein
MVGIPRLFVLLLAVTSLAVFSQLQPLSAHWSGYSSPSTSFSFLSSSSSSSSITTSTSSYEAFEGIDLGISFQFPSSWVKYEAGFDLNLINNFEGVVSFDVVDDDPLIQTDELSPDTSGLAHPNLSILSIKSPYQNVTLEQYAKAKTFDIRQLFSDYNLHITESMQSNETIDGFPYWIIDYYFTIGNETQRYGMYVLLIRGEKVYEISYIADGYEDFVRNLEEIKKMIESAYFVDPASHG